MNRFCWDVRGSRTRRECLQRQPEVDSRVVRSGAMPRTPPGGVSLREFDKGFEKVDTHKDFILRAVERIIALEERKSDE